MPIRISDSPIMNADIAIVGRGGCRACIIAPNTHEAAPTKASDVGPISVYTPFHSPSFYCA